MNKSRLQEKYEKEVIPQLVKEFGIKNKMAVPKIVKVVVNIGVGSVIKNKELVESLKKDLAAITGQRPSVRVAKVSIASFSLRIGMPVGLAVTLRKERMYAFLDRIFSVVLPRLRDFRGVSRKSFDRDGNYTLGFAEHSVFPEVDIARSSTHGMEMTIVTNSGSKKVSERLLTLLGMPFEKI
jgi:large subunit ribosomal protein L5